MACLFKIKFQDTLRRVMVDYREDGKPDLTFKALEAKVRDMFAIAPHHRLIITYRDEEGDIVTMAEDHDLHDACTIQYLRPLRLDIKVLNERMCDSEDKGTKSLNQPPVVAPQQAPLSPQDVPVKEFVASITADAVKQLLGSSDPSAKVISHEALSEVVKSLVKGAKDAVSSHPSCSVTFTPSASSLSAPSVVNAHSTSNVSERGVIGNATRVLHNGVQCNSCGTMPVVGSLFKSTRNEDHDLCFGCSTEIGNISDYVKLDRPKKYEKNYLLSGVKMLNRTRLKPRLPKERSPSGHSTCYANKHFVEDPSIWKFDARFVKDISIPDGAEVPAGTCFTKVWRLQNSGTVPWPRLTQLVYVGGDMLGSDYRPSSLKILEEGLQFNEEIDVSVDLVAPRRPGRYVSHWRLMAPSGQKFGQRVWVLIQVVPEVQGASSTEAKSIELKDVGEMGVGAAFRGGVSSLPSHISNCEPNTAREIFLDYLIPTLDELSTFESTNSTNEEHFTHIHTGDQSMVMIESNLDMVRSDLGSFSLINKPAELTNTGKHEEQPLELEVDKNLKISSPLKSIVAFDHQTKDAFAADASKCEHVNGKEEDVLQTLNAMGFAQTKLNKELLHKNKFDMQATIDDLVATSEWDYVLDDLNEMGFSDMETNCLLLSKNKGSVKLVVKELLQMQRSGSPSSKAVL